MREGIFCRQASTEGSREARRDEVQVHQKEANPGRSLIPNCYKCAVRRGELPADKNGGIERRKECCQFAVFGSSAKGPGLWSKSETIQYRKTNRSPNDILLWGRCMVKAIWFCWSRATGASRSPSGCDFLGAALGECTGKLATVAA